MRAGISDDRHTKQAVLKSVRNYLGAKLPKMIVSEKPSVDAGHEETLRNSGSPVRYQSADVSLSATSHSLFQPENTLVTGNHSKITTEAKLLQKKEKIGLIDPTPLVWIETLVPVYYQTFEMQESTDHVTKEFDNVDEVKVSPGKHRFESDELSDDFKTPKRGPGTSQLIGDECSFSTNKETEHSGGQSPEILDFVGIETTHHPSAKTLDPPLEDAEFLEEEIPKQSATKTQASQNEKISGFSAEKNFGSLSGEVLEPIAYETLSFSGNEIPESITDGAAKSFNKEISGNTEETASGYVASIESTAGEVPLSSEKKTLASEDNETHIFQSSAFIEKKILACNVQGVSELAQDEASRSTYERVPEFRKNEAFGFSLLEEFKSEAVKNVKDEITGEAFGSLDEEIAKHGKNEALGPLMPTHIGKETSGCADENAVELHEEIIAGSQNIETQELSRNEASELRDEKDMKFVEKDLVVKEVIKPSEDEIPSKPSGDETLSFLDEQVLEDTENNAVKCEEFLENIRKKTPPRSDESAVGICSEACLTEEQTILEVQVKDESQKRKLEILHMISFPSLDAAEILVKVEPEFLNRTEQESLQKTVKRPEFSGNENKTDSELPSKTTFTNVVSTSTRMDESSGEEQVPQKTAAAESASFEESAKSEVLAGVTAKTLSPESKEFDENTGTNADKEQDLEGTAMAFTLQTIHAKQEERGPTEIAAETLSGEQVSEQQSVNSRNRNRGAGSGGDAGAFYGRQRQKKWRRGGMYSDMADACGGGGAGRNAQQEPTDSRNYMQEQGYVRFSDYQQEQGSSTIQSQYQQQTGGAGKGGESHRKRNKRNRR
ncbi:unnamed protein product, partial [Gongylonema pulchrum]|uniref:Reticulon n=1 Tax=Gongylonema pulchrum TaxID=637853 RepID=A0A183D795_9BILA